MTKIIVILVECVYIEAFAATKFKTIFSGTQLRQGAKLLEGFKDRVSS